YWQHLEWQDVADWQQLTEQLQAPRLWCFSKHAPRCYTEVHYQSGDALVFGSETQGLPPSLRERYADTLVRIPMRPQARSLNLASAAAVAIYEAQRQISQSSSSCPPLSD